MSVATRDQLYALKWQGTVQSVSISASAASNATELGAGLYEIVSTVDCFFRQTTSSGEAATTDYPLFAGERLLVHVQDEAGGGADTYISFITASGSGTAYICPRTS